MPTVKNITGPFRFFFYSFDCGEPMHVHVRRERMGWTVWVDPVVLASNEGCFVHELNRIRTLIVENREAIVEAWDEHCGK